MIEPRRTRWRSFALATTVSAVFLTRVTSCALLGKGDPVAPDYLTPSPPEPVVSSPATSEPDARPNVAVRLRRVRAAAHLGRRVVVRRRNHEVAFLERTRWTDPPRDLVERRLARTLYERWGLTRIVGGDGLTLEVTLRAFALDLSDPERPHALVELTRMLHDERRALFQKTMARKVATGVPTDDDGALVPDETFARAMSDALDEALDELARNVIEAAEPTVPAVALDDP